jgi:hypothetical protein
LNPTLLNGWLIAWQLIAGEAVLSAPGRGGGMTSLYGPIFRAKRWA